MPDLPLSNQLNPNWMKSNWTFFEPTKTFTYYLFNTSKAYIFLIKAYQLLISHMGISGFEFWFHELIKIFFHCFSCWFINKNQASKISDTSYSYKAAKLCYKLIKLFLIRWMFSWQWYLFNVLKIYFTS